MSETPTAAAVIDRVRAAFAHVAPGRMSVHEAEAWDSYGTAEELAAARALDTETHWSEVDPRTIAECTTALSHLDREGWRFYLPAYMVWVLGDPRSSMAIDNTIYTLELSDDDADLKAYDLDRYESLDAAQSQATCAFLRVMASRADRCDATAAQRAIEKYWGRFEG